MRTRSNANCLLCILSDIESQHHDEINHIRKSWDGRERVRVQPTKKRHSPRKTAAWRTQYLTSVEFYVDSVPFGLILFCFVLYKSIRRPANTKPQNKIKPFDRWVCSIEENKWNRRKQSTYPLLYGEKGQPIHVKPSWIPNHTIIPSHCTAIV